MYCQSRITGLNNESYEEKEGMRTAKTQKKKKKKNKLFSAVYWVALVVFAFLYKLCTRQEKKMGTCVSKK